MLSQVLSLDMLWTAFASLEEVPQASGPEPEPKLWPQSPVLAVSLLHCLLKGGSTVPVDWSARYGLDGFQHFGRDYFGQRSTMLGYEANPGMCWTLDPFRSCQNENPP